MIASKLMKTLAMAAAAVLAAAVQAQPTVVRVQDYPGMAGTMTRVAIEKGYCAKYGLECVLQSIPSAPLGMQTLLSGGIDIAAVAPEVAVQAVAKGASIKAIGNMLNANSIMLFYGAPLAGAVDQGYPDMLKALKGKKVGVVGRGTATEFQLKTMLEDAGLKIEDVTPVAVGAPNTAYPALVNAQVDAMMSFMPIDGFCEVLKTCRIGVATHTGKGPAALTRMNGTGSLYVMKRDQVAANPAIAERFEKAVREAERFIGNPANADEVFRITSKYYKLDMPRGDEIVKSSLQRFAPHWKVDISRQAVQATADYLLQTGQLDKPVDTSKLF